MTEFVGVTAKLYDELIQGTKHILIAGMTGSGKSVFMNGMINSILYENVNEHAMVLCDVKIVEFSKYKNTKHCLRCATTPEDVESTLEGVMRMIKMRLKDMEERNIVVYDKTIVHLFIDEMADLILTSKKSAELLQRICQLGRAAGVQVICATQCPLASIIPTKIKVNFPIIVGLHTATTQHSRNILEENGCECLPMYGEALIKYPTVGIQRTVIPMISNDWIKKIIDADRK